MQSEGNTLSYDDFVAWEAMTNILLNLSAASSSSNLENPFPPSTAVNQPVAAWQKQFRKLTKQTTQMKLPTASDVQVTHAVQKGWHVRDVQIWRKVVELAKHTSDLADAGMHLMAETIRVAKLVGHHPIGLINLARNALHFTDWSMAALNQIEALFHKHQADAADDDDASTEGDEVEIIEERPDLMSPTQRSPATSSSGEAPSQEAAHAAAKRGMKRSSTQASLGPARGKSPDAEELL